ncbi:hypothetical protein RRG08_056091 [Elysia crispata]|uniref:Uncharacterized protein n=1 Tax=Elysia crispata TaxID=231223 RepID=A0AAE0ZBN4_9GAST|nr:hypothetical protein RRG08_056091 [Elysia crispata]
MNVDSFLECPWRPSFPLHLLTVKSRRRRQEDAKDFRVRPLLLVHAGVGPKVCTRHVGTCMCSVLGQTPVRDMRSGS